MPISNVHQELDPGFDLRAYVLAEEQTVGDWQWALIEQYFAERGESTPEVIQQGEGWYSSTYRLPDGREVSGYELSDYVRMQSLSIQKTAQDFNTWFDTFLGEKQLPYASWDIMGEDGTPHMIDSEVVIESIKGTSEGEQAEIKDTIVKIDFANGDVNDYFKHLAEALVKQYGSAF